MAVQLLSKEQAQLAALSWATLTSGTGWHLQVDVDEEADAVPRDDGGVHGVKELLTPCLLLGLAAIVRVALEVPCKETEGLSRVAPA